MPEQMSEPKVNQFIFAMQDQGVVVTRTKKGLFLRLPNGESTTLHFTNSDTRAKQNLIARLRRAGVRHPEDDRGVDKLPPTITESGQPAPKTRTAILEHVRSNAYPEVVHVLDIAEVSGLEHVTISRALYHMGFLPTKGKRNTRDWLTPEEILAERPPVGIAAEPPAATFNLTGMVHRARKAQEAVNDLGAGKPDVDRFGQTQEEQEEVGLSSLADDLEFIDTRDSWVIPLEKMVGETYWRIIKDRFEMLDILGMDYEVRVWRK